jgi:hypothetical protein
VLTRAIRNTPRAVLADYLEVVELVEPIESLRNAYSLPGQTAVKNRRTRASRHQYPTRHGIKTASRCHPLTAALDE